VPRCQRTFRSLRRYASPSETGANRWVCPFCPEAEVYEAVTDADLSAYAASAEAACIADFGKPSDPTYPVVLISGLYPECVRETDDRRYDIYLQRDAAPEALRLQIGHETFHRVCSQGRVFHWTHEMLACLLSVRLLRQNGFTEYADRMERQYAQQADLLSVAAMRGADLSASPYPPGLYGRAFVTGQRLETAVGWPALCRLARTLDRAGGPDLPRWLGRLPADARSAIGEILTVTN
jgi:hypothetical protein